MPVYQSISGCADVCDEKPPDLVALISSPSQKVLACLFAQLCAAPTLDYGSTHAKGLLPYEMSVPTSVEAHLYFHVTALAQRKVGGNKQNIVQTAADRAMTGVMIQSVQNAPDALTKSSMLRQLLFLIQPYLSFKPPVIQSDILCLRSDGLVSLTAEDALLEAEECLQAPGVADTTAIIQSLEVDDAIRFLRSSVLAYLVIVILKDPIYSLCDERPELNKLF